MFLIFLSADYLSKTKDPLRQACLHCQTEYQLLSFCAEAQSGGMHRDVRSRSSEHRRLGKDVLGGVVPGELPDRAYLVYRHMSVHGKEGFHLTYLPAIR